jgi:site-specific DNA-methyltransferase (adenine-specific)
MKTMRFEHKDCLELLKELPDGCVDLMLQDPPYGTTACDWDKVPNLAEMWMEWERVLKPNGAWIFTASQPFASELIVSRKGFFKYEIIWDKISKGDVINAKNKPLRQHENILVFSRATTANGSSFKMVYNPQNVKGANRKPIKNSTSEGRAFNPKRKSHPEVYEYQGSNYPSSIIQYSNGDRTNALHPTQKPVDLMRYLIKTYSNEGDTVFDGYAGSGTSAIACIIEKRKFIGCELNAEYYSKAVDRIKRETSKLVLF